MSEHLLEGPSFSLFGAGPQAAPAFYRTRVKRWLDLILVLTALPVVLPLVLVLAALVACEGASPFYGHARVGRCGRIFRCWTVCWPIISTRTVRPLPNGQQRASWRTIPA